MAEFVLKDLVEKAGTASRFAIASSATSREEIGNGMHRGTKAKLREMHIPFTEHRANRLDASLYDRYDLFIGMDSANLRNMKAIFGSDPENKIHLLLEYTSRPGNIADPWYTDDFDTTYGDILEGCKGLLASLGFSFR
jgi:protein-tyrosine phosphatase